MASNKFFGSLAAKCEFIRDRNEIKNRKWLSLPDWAPEELWRLGRTLRTGIIASQKKKILAKNRIAWQSGQDFHELWEMTLAKAIQERPDQPELHRFLMHPWGKILTPLRLVKKG